MARKLNYNVVFESNIIFGRPINREVINLVRNYKDNENINIKFYVPEVVVDEAKKHLIDDFLKVKGRYNAAGKDLYEIIKKGKFKNRVVKEQTIFRIVEKAFIENEINILETPVVDIKWAEIIKKALYKKSPFDPGENTEKGFKDAIIAETILVSLSALSKNSLVVLLCNDSLLVDFLNKKAKKYKSFKIFPSIPDFESSLRFHLFEVSEELKEEITKLAESAFYKPLDKNSLFHKEELPKKLFEKFPTLLINPKIEDDLYYGVRVWNTNAKTLWVPIGGPNFEVSTPAFVEKKNNTYVWESTIVYRQIFENQETAQNPLYTGFSHKGEYRIEFKVKWQSELTGDKILTEKCAIIDIDDKPRVLHGGYNPMRRYSIASGATIAGQGTVQVVEPLVDIPVTQGKWCSNCNQYFDRIPEDGLCPNCGKSL